MARRLRSAAVLAARRLRGVSRGFVLVPTLSSPLLRRAPPLAVGGAFSSAVKYGDLFDPWLVSDPWASYAPRVAPSPAVSPSTSRFSPWAGWAPGVWARSVDGGAMSSPTCCAPTLACPLRRAASTFVPRDAGHAGGVPSRSCDFTELKANFDKLSAQVGHLADQLREYRALGAAASARADAQHRERADEQTREAKALLAIIHSHITDTNRDNLISIAQRVDDRFCAALAPASATARGASGGVLAGAASETHHKREVFEVVSSPSAAASRGVAPDTCDFVARLAGLDAGLSSLTATLSEGLACSVEAAESVFLKLMDFRRDDNTDFEERFTRLEDSVVEVCRACAILSVTCGVPVFLPLEFASAAVSDDYVNDFLSSCRGLLLVRHDVRRLRGASISSE